MAHKRPDRLERAAIRWHGRLEFEASTLTMSESIFALTAITQLEHDPERVREVLRRFLHRAHPTSVKPMR